MAEVEMDMNDPATKAMEIKLHPGYETPFSRKQYPTAKYKNGTYVTKVRTEPGDIHRVGDRGIVLGSLGHPAMRTVLYFVSFNRRPKRPVAIVEDKLGPGVAPEPQPDV